ncbi:MAG: amidohydrolase family protein [Candidatus Cloacimonetes bacterium]|nr:amidohydrolase family protein [Candidatus Cloacimonadota bacterium]
MKFLLKNGLIWFKSGFRKQDILIENQKIVEISDNINSLYTQEIDCTDCYVIPGVIDLHVHTGEPIKDLLLAEEESITTISSLKGGVTSIGTFITETVKDSIKESYPNRKKRFYRLPITTRWHLTPVVTKLSQLKDLLIQDCDIKLYTTYKEAGIYSSYKRISEMMIYLKGLGLRMKREPVRILIHCEDNTIIEEKRQSIPFDKPFTYTLRRPEIAEIKAVDEVLNLAVKHNYPLHIVHVSSPESALLIKEAKKSAPVTCETAPQYLFLNEEILLKKNGHRWLCTPPLRSERSRGKMVELAQEGIFDAFASDHCPFAVYDKDRYASEPDKVPMGLPGVGALLPLLYEGLVASGKMSLSTLITHLTTNPARILNIYPEKGIIQENSDADLVIFKIIEEEKSAQVQPTVAIAHNPWADRQTSLSIKKVLVKGKLMVDL